MSVPAASPEAERVRHLVRLDARLLVERFTGRRDDMVTIFSRQRDRSALIEPVHSLLPTLRFGDLVVLEPKEQEAVLRFATVVEELRWYLRYTDHMPGALSDALDDYRRALTVAHDQLVLSLAEPVLLREPHDASVEPPARQTKKKAAGGTKKKAATATKKAATKKAAAKKPLQARAAAAGKSTRRT